MKQAINLTGKGAGVKKAAKSRVRGTASAEEKLKAAGQGQIAALPQPDIGMFENPVITVPKLSTEVKTRARGNSKRVSNENTHPEASFTAEELAAGQIQVSKKSIRSTRAAKLAEKQNKTLNTDGYSEECTSKAHVFDESIGN